MFVVKNRLIYMCMLKENRSLYIRIWKLEISLQAAELHHCLQQTSLRGMHILWIAYQSRTGQYVILHVVQFSILIAQRPKLSPRFRSIPVPR